MSSLMRSDAIRDAVIQRRVELCKAIMVIASLTDTKPGVIADALTCYSWSEEECGELLAILASEGVEL